MLLLVMGNSRWHWGCLDGGELVATWDLPPAGDDGLPLGHSPVNRGRLDLNSLVLGEPIHSWDLLAQHQWPLYYASVTPQYQAGIQHHPQAQAVTTSMVPLGGLYPTLGVDRALNLWGGGAAQGWPLLVIDGGTALTLSGADQEGRFAGGLILPGLSLQFRSLGQGTAKLPDLSQGQAWRSWVVHQHYWHHSTPEAIVNGVIQGVLLALGGFMRDWCDRYPHSRIYLTGGDGDFLAQSLHQSPWALGRSIPAPIYDPHLTLKGLQRLVIPQVLDPL